MAFSKNILKKPINIKLTYYSLYPIYFNTRYNTKLLQIKCKMFFFLLALLENPTNKIKLIKYNTYCFNYNKFTFPRAPYKNKLSQITIGQKIYKLHLYIRFFDLLNTSTNL